MIAKRIVFLAAALLAAAPSCSKKNRVEITAEGDIVIAPEPAEDFSSSPAWHHGESSTMVILGYGFNDADFVAQAKAELERKFGLAEEGGAVALLVYPDDFKHGGSPKISDIKDHIDEAEAGSLVIFGAPENTSAALGRVQDSYDGEHVFPVISFFHQDDTMGIESVSDLVFESIKLAQGAENSQPVRTEPVKMLCNAVEQVQQIPQEEFSQIDLKQLADKIAGKVTNRYVDSETRLVSANHFVIP